MLVCNSPQLIAAYHVLHRLLEPRHPPCALNCFKKIRNKNLSFLLLLFGHYLINVQILDTHSNNFSQYVKELIPINRNWQMCWTWTNRFAWTNHIIKNKELHFICWWRISESNRWPSRQRSGCIYSIELTTHFCGGYRSRTDDPLRARQML